MDSTVLDFIVLISFLNLLEVCSFLFIKILMAPSRRKGSGKPAKTAGNRQWNVGDLVLAKVKGFQAWPAVVSEPKKWGYSADWKKVLVCFFGTKQIAFCNPTEVEAFTEEKKNSLLSKRHGRGSDFFRAIQEIVDSFDNSSKCYDNSNVCPKINKIMEEGAVTSVLNSPTSCDDHVETEKLPESPMKMLSLPQKTVSANGTSGTSSPIKNLSDSLHPDDSFDEGSLSGKSMDKTGISAVITNYTIESSWLTEKENNVDTNEESAARSTRSSSRAELCKFYNVKESCSNADIISMEHKPIQNSTQSLQSPPYTDTNSPTFDSNSAIVEHVSEIPLLEFVAPGSSILNMPDSGDKYEKHDVVVDGKASLSKNSIVLKKRRKQNRKVVKKDLPSHPFKVTIGTNTALEDGRMCSSNISSQIVSEKCLKEDSDEHLPLLKRARVRLGKPSSTDCFTLSKECNPNLDEVNSSLSVFKPILSNGDAYRMNSVAEKSSFSNNFPKEVEYVTPYQNNKCDNSFVCSIDVESTLPPSKRLHRALEAMSANISDDGEILVQPPSSSPNMLHDACHFENPPVVAENKNDCGFLTNEVEFLNNNISSFESVSIFGLKASEAPRAINPNTSTDNHFSHYSSSNSLNQNLSSELKIYDATDPSRKDLISEEPETTFIRDIQSPELERANSSSRSETIATDIVSNPNTEGLLQREDVSVNSLPDVEKENDMCVVSKELCQNSCLESNNTSLSSSDLGVDIYLNSMKRCISSPSTIIAGPAVCKSDESFFDISSNTSPTTNIVSPGEEVLLHRSSSSDRFYKSDNSCNSLKNEGFVCSSKKGSTYLAQVLYPKPKTSTNYSSSSHANAALKSFGTIIRSLTRTKEIIGRATRVALDCARFGYASKVVEIITCSLEAESKLYKRVDLLFLVDSIIQCSQAMKGELGRIYLSIIEAALPRLLVAAAPPGKAARENHKQCQKVLRIWLERKIFPESTVHSLVQQLNCLTYYGSLSVCSGMKKRALNDPLREMDMPVDEYGSNSSFQLPDHRISQFIEDNDSGSDSDGGIFEAVTPEHNSKISEYPKIIDGYSTEKHCRILEDVDGELEMEDVAPLNEGVGGNCNVPETLNTSDCLTNRSEKPFPLLFPPPLPTDMPPSSPPLPSSPPPAPPPLFSILPCQSFSFSENRSYYEHQHPPKNDTESSVGRTEGASSTSYWQNSDPINFHGYENSDFPISNHIYESSSSRPIEHSPVISPNLIPCVESESSFYNSKASLLRPPLPVPSNHFSYVDKHVPRAEKQQSFYSNRPKCAPVDRYMNVYSDMDVMKPVDSYRPGERSRQAFVDDDEVSAFLCMESERNHFFRSQGRPFPSRRFDCRDFPLFHYRFDSAFSTNNRASRYWHMRKRRW